MTRCPSPHIGLRGLPFSWRLLITGFVLILGSGYLMGALNAALAVGLSPTAIADHYGDKSLSEAERQAIESQGFVEEEFSLDEEPLETEGVQGTDETEGHGAAGSAAHASMGDDTLPAQVLVQVSHVHLLGFALILISAGALACLTTLPEPLKVTLVSLLFLGLAGDIAGLNLVRFVAGGFAWLTFLSALLVGLCLAFISIRVLWELWGPMPAADARDSARANTG